MSCLTVEPPSYLRWLSTGPSAIEGIGKTNMLACPSTPLLRSPSVAHEASETTSAAVLRANNSRFRPVIDVNGGNQPFLSLLNSSNGGDSGTSGALKRKRPPPISIPCSGGAQIMVPDNGPSQTSSHGLRHAVLCKKGRRPRLEDTFAAAPDHLGDSSVAFFGIFDGHSGNKAAEYAAANIGKNIMNSLTHENNNLEEAVRAGYLATDAEFLKQKIGGGTTCVTALIMEGSLVTSNVGDSRAVLSRNGVAEALTHDHRPGREDEKLRIENLGGYVDCRHGIWRVQGSLGVSRAIGDMHMKEFIIAEPESRTVDITPECEFLIMGSDGLWDKVGNQEAVDIARRYCVQEKQYPGGPIAACKKLVDLAAQREALDDISVMIIQLGHLCPAKL